MIDPMVFNPWYVLTHGISYLHGLNLIMGNIKIILHYFCKCDVFPFHPSSLPLCHAFVCLEVNKRETVGQSLLHQSQMGDLWSGRKIIQPQQKEHR